MSTNNLKEAAHLTVCVDELCDITQRELATIINIVDHGIVEPAGDKPQNWRFTTTMVVTTQKALRLHNDLDIDWPGIALAMSLMDELQYLREHNRALKQYIDRLHV